MSDSKVHLYHTYYDLCSDHIANALRKEGIEYEVQSYWWIRGVRTNYDIYVSPGDLTRAQDVVSREQSRLHALGSTALNRRNIRMVLLFTAVFALIFLLSYLTDR